MATKNLVLLITAEQEYIRHSDDEKQYAALMGSVFESISDIYMPLLNMFISLEHDNIPFRLALVLPPVLCTLLADPVVQKQYINWLDKRIELGKRELERCSGNPKLIDTVKLCLEKAQEDRIDFITVYGQNLLKQFSLYQKKGYIELLGTCGTDIFLPHYADMEEVMNAQVEIGLQAHRYFFGEMPEGFWLPEMGYCTGVEKVLRSYGLNYTVLDSRSLLFSETEPEKGIFSPARCENSLGIFARDCETDEELFGKEGFASNPLYRDQNRDIGFELPLENLEPYLEKGYPRYASGYRYWKRQPDGTDEDNVRFTDPSTDKNIYDGEQAMQQCTIDAADFISRKFAKLEKAEQLLPSSQSVSIVCTFNAEQFKRNWYEGISWIEQVYRYAVNKPLQFSLFNNLLDNQYCLQKIRPYYGACSGTGYGENLLSSKNCWMIRYIRKASERMVDLVDRFPDDTGLKARLLNLGAKELVLAQSSGWARMLDEDYYPEYAEQRFKESILAFTTVFDSLGSNTVSTEWLTDLETRHPLFPWMNYRIFSRKK
jgi:1,4-alpha-glucan branching enzyme